MKALPPGSYIVRPYKTYKGYSYSYSYLGASNDSFISIDEALPPPDKSVWMTGVDPTNLTGISKYTLYNSLDKLFYNSSSRTVPGANRNWDISDGTSGSYVISISSYAYGERIRPTSFRLTAALSTASITDNGSGVLYSSTAPSTSVGNIFYSLGIIVIPKMLTTASVTSSVLSDEGLYLLTGSNLTITYESQNTLYEHTVYCTIEKNEYNFSTNPSLQIFSSSSVSGSEAIGDSFRSGTLTPYITTLGLFNSIGEMVAVAKVPRAIQRIPDIDQTFVVKIDIY